MGEMDGPSLRNQISEVFADTHSYDVNKCLISIVVFDRQMDDLADQGLVTCRKGPAATEAQRKARNQRDVIYFSITQGGHRQRSALIDNEISKEECDGLLQPV